MPDGLIVDLFAGVGWSVGLCQLGLSDVGIELDRSACATRTAAGFATIRADVATYPTKPFRGRVEGLIASPPCQDFSAAGKRRGLAGATGRLVLEVMRWARDLRPLWIACEQVPGVLPVWEEFAWELRGLGYSTWTGILCAVDWGVPQTRERAFLLAHRTRPALPPEPTHCRGGRPADFWGRELLPWVSMAEALGWDGEVEKERGAGMEERHGARRRRPTAEPAPAVTAGSKGSGPRLILHANRDQRLNGDRLAVAVDQPAPAFTGKAGGQAMQWAFVNGNQPHAARRGPHEPAPTIHFGHNLNGVAWVAERPATTIVGSFGRGRVAPPTHHENGTYSTPGTVRVSVAEAAVLQGFPPDFPFQGTKTARFAQVGNAVPPPWAAAIVAALRGDGRAGR